MRPATPSRALARLASSASMTPSAAPRTAAASSAAAASAGRAGVDVGQLGLPTRPARRGAPAPGRPARPGGRPTRRARAAAPRPDGWTSPCAAGPSSRVRWARRRSPFASRSAIDRSSSPSRATIAARRRSAAVSAVPGGRRRFPLGQPTSTVASAGRSRCPCPAAPAGRRSARNDGGPERRRRHGCPRIEVVGGDRRPALDRFEAADTRRGDRRARRGGAVVSVGLACAGGAGVRAGGAGGCGGWAGLANPAGPAGAAGAAGGDGADDVAARRHAPRQALVARQVQACRLTSRRRRCVPVGHRQVGVGRIHERLPDLRRVPAALHPRGVASAELGDVDHRRVAVRDRRPTPRS